MKDNSIITRWPDSIVLADAVAHLILVKSHEAINRYGYFTLALSGGSTPGFLYQLLARSPFKENIQWDKVVIFLSDERFVPASSEESNFRMIEENMLRLIAIPAANVFPIETTGLTPAESALNYEKKIRQYVNSKHPFDLVLLGMGDDGHTASIFPKSPLLKETKRLVREVFVPEKNMHRISFTLPLINKAANAAFLVAGKGKAAMLQTILGQKKTQLPAALVHPAGNLYWFLDKDAASLL